MEMLRTIAVALLLATSAGLALADDMPKGAVKLTKAEATAIYAGKTARWVNGGDDDAIAYFAPDGVILMHGPKKNWYGEGRWTVSSNKVCQQIKWHGLDGNSGSGKKHCWTWVRDPKGKLWDLWSGEDPKHGWWDGELKKLSKGDKVTKTYNALKAKAAG
jgi:hypothetical protein